MTGPYLDFPYHLDGRGRAAQTAEDEHIRDMIFQVLFTDPGERVNRPDFGCGLKALVFMPNSDVLAAATQTLVKGSLQKWLEREIQVEQVEVKAEENVLTVTVVYRLRIDGDSARWIRSARPRRRYAMPNDPIPVCQDEQQRRADVLANPALNGIDFVEVDPVDHSVLQVFFLKPVPPLNPANPADPDDAFGLSADLTRTVVRAARASWGSGR